jgi:hypothetical protein
MSRGLQREGSRRATILLLAFAALPACGQAPERPAAEPRPAAPVQAPATVPHGDHNPHHGGVVMMKGDLHYEVVLDPSGREYRLFFSDATREDLPAAYASAVTVTVRRPGEGDEIVALKIDDTGESWVGAGKPVTNPAKTGARIAFTVANDPYWIDVPFVPAGDSSPAHVKPKP